MNKCICVVSALAAIFAVCDAAPRCDGFEIVRCIFLTPEGFDISDPRFPETDRELDERCRASLPFMECIIKAVTLLNPCPPKDTSNQYFNSITEQKKVEEQLCRRDSDLRKRCLAQSVCLNKQLQELEATCGNAVEIDADFLNKRDCEAYLKYRQCHADITKKNCGMDGLNFVKEFDSPTIKSFDVMCHDLQQETMNNN